MTGSIRVFVNEQAVTVPPGSQVRDALAMAGLAGDASALRVTDARGLQVPLDTKVGPGTILRAFLPARRAADDHT